MANIVNDQNGAYRYITNVSLGTTAATPNGNSIDMRTFSQGIIYASSTHGTPVLTFWTAASSSGTFRLMKTSTGGAVALTVIANSAMKMPAAVSAAQFVRLSSSTTAAYKTIPAVLLKK